jgi:phosphate transport system protein
MLKRTNLYQIKMEGVNKNIEESFKCLLLMLKHLKSFIAEASEDKRKDIIELEDKVNEIEVLVEKQIIELLSLQQPHVDEMKRLLSNMKINRELERIGDHIINFINMYQLSSSHPDWMKEELINIVEQEAEMLQNVYYGITKEEASYLKTAIKADDKIDDLHIVLFEKLVSEMKQNTLKVETGSQLIIMIRFLERLGDHIVNAGETHLEYFIE